MHTLIKHTLLGTALLSLCAAPPALANIIINYNAVQAVSSYSQATMDSIAGTTFYFEHASVGSNMISGLDALHSSNGSFYRFSTASEDATAPASITGGTVYEYARGNPGWEAKVTDFASDITASWGGKVDFALNKFCYIDPDANWTTYRDSMLALEAANPGTTFVYMTIPLEVSSGANVQRGVFNQTLRSWAAANNKVVFDIADIEAHSSSGALQTFSSGGQLYEQMAVEWSSDGGHLNTAGEALVARGFYALAAQSSAIPEPTTYAALFGGMTLLFVLWRRFAMRRS
ncbi:MAG TPA: PEP-CTERM sorting domain-containing protein [Opitutaceae bacterium]|nr:PEP-CTERM sorting domain-containing protein [Opitutaceae bacterium]